LYPKFLSVSLKTVSACAASVASVKQSVLAHLAQPQALRCGERAHLAIKQGVDDCEQVCMVCRGVHCAAPVLLVQSIAQPLHQFRPFGVIACHKIICPGEDFKIGQYLQAALTPAPHQGTRRSNLRQGEVLCENASSTPVLLKSTSDAP